MNVILYLIAVGLFLVLPHVAYSQASDGLDCQRVGMLAAAAVRNRLQGVTKEQMQSSLPPLDQPEERRGTPEYRLLEVMHQILQEVFDGDALNETAYMVYKMESCFQIASAGKSPRPFEDVRLELQACGRLPDGDAIIECSMVTAGAEQ